jgi:hypothetical protein
MFSSWDAGCRHFFHLVDRVSQARTCALAGDKETLNFAKVGLETGILISDALRWP